MPIKLHPNYTITLKITYCLMRIASAKERVLYLPLTSTVLKSLRETARLYTTHYSTMIEGNKLNAKQVQTVLAHAGHFPGRERDEEEIRGYYVALNQVEQWSKRGIRLTEKIIQTLHALVMADGQTSVKPTPYRDGQNIIRDSSTKAIVYMPPEASDVKNLMRSMVAWVYDNAHIPCPIVAGIIHYQFATIHPYYDGNGRTARLLTTLILHLGGYDLKGIYSLEEYYAKDLNAYYEAISIGSSHNYYEGRATADITKWLAYFIEGMALSFGRVLKRMGEAQSQGQTDQSKLLKTLDARQRKALTLFEDADHITSRQVGELFGFKARTSTALCANWVKNGFLAIANPSNKARKYALSDHLHCLIN